MSVQEANLGTQSDIGAWTNKQVRDLLLRVTGHRVALEECLLFIREIGLVPNNCQNSPTYPRAFPNWEQLLKPEFARWRDHQAPQTLSGREKILAKLPAENTIPRRGSIIISKRATQAIAKKFLLEDSAISKIKKITANLENIAQKYNSEK